MELLQAFALWLRCQSAGEVLVLVRGFAPGVQALLTSLLMPLPCGSSDTSS